MDDTGTTATSYTDATATTGGETYAYQVKAIRGEDRSEPSGEASGQAKIRIPHDPADLAPTGLTAVVTMTASVVRSGGGLHHHHNLMFGLSWTAPAEGVRERHRLRDPAGRG